MNEILAHCRTQQIKLWKALSDIYVRCCCIQFLKKLFKMCIIVWITSKRLGPQPIFYIQFCFQFLAAGNYWLLLIFQMRHRFLDQLVHRTHRTPYRIFCKMEKGNFH